MTIVSEKVRSGPFSPNGVTTKFPFDFQITPADGVKIEIDGATVDTASYVVDLNDNGTGEVVFFVAPVGNELWIESAPAFDQQDTLKDQGPYFQNTIEKILDSLAVRSLWLRDWVTRSPLIPIEDNPTKGMYPVVGPDGRWTWSSGTGSDPALRQDIASPDPGKGAALSVAEDGADLQQKVDVAATPADLIASTRSLVPGSSVRTADDNSYDVLASDATDYDIATASSPPALLKYKSKETPVPARAFGVSEINSDNARAFSRAMKSLWENGGGTLALPPGEFRSAPYEQFGATGRSGIFNMRSNVHIVGQGTVIKHVGTGHHASGILAVEVDGWSVDGVKFLGNKEEFAPIVENNGGIGLYISGCNDWSVVNTVSSNWNIDGLYLGRGRGEIGRPTNINGYIRNFLAENNGRQGISIITADGLLCENIVLRGTVGADGSGLGTAPGDGMDIEPNQPDEFLRNIVFNNLLTAGNLRGAGVKFYLDKLDDTSEPISIVFRNFVSRGNQYGLRFRRGSPSGHIAFEGQTFLDRNWLRDFSYEDMQGSTTRIASLDVVSGADFTPAGETPNLLSPVIIGENNNNPPSPTRRGVEGLTIDEFSLKIRDGVFDRGLAIAAQNQPFARNISIGVKEISGQSLVNTEVGVTGIPEALSNIHIFPLGVENPTLVGLANSAGHQLTNYSQYRFKDKVRVSASTTVNVSGLLSGMETTIENVRSGAASPVTVAAGGAAMWPVAAGSTITLTGRGSWVRIRRDADGELRVIGGAGWSAST